MSHPITIVVPPPPPSPPPLPPPPPPSDNRELLCTIFVVFLFFVVAGVVGGLIGLIWPIRFTPEPRPRVQLVSFAFFPYDGDWNMTLRAQNPNSNTLHLDKSFKVSVSHNSGIPLITSAMANWYEVTTAPADVTFVRIGLTRDSPIDDSLTRELSRPNGTVLTASVKGLFYLEYLDLDDDLDEVERVEFDVSCEEIWVGFQANRTGLAAMLGQPKDCSVQIP